MPNKAALKAAVDKAALSTDKAKKERIKKLKKKYMKKCMARQKKFEIPKVKPPVPGQMGQQNNMMGHF